MFIISAWRDMGKFNLPTEQSMQGRLKMDCFTAKDLSIGLIKYSIMAILCNPRFVEQELSNGPMGISMKEKC